MIPSGADALREAAARALSALHATHPCINHITNFVVMNDTANITIMTGARPVMGHALEEAGLFATDALVINAGNATFTDWNEAMIRCSHEAYGRNRPVVLDPVGIGANEVRTRMIRRILAEGHVDIIRGNQGEIGALSGLGGRVRGVDAIVGLDDPAKAVAALALSTGAVCAVGGESDYVSDGRRTARIRSGHRYLTMLTGTGCMATSVIAAFAAVERDYFAAACAALGMYRLAAERAGRAAGGPGTFRALLLDEMANMAPDDLGENLPAEMVA
jgi:hydroxyethylthiazole kinase